MVNCLQFLVILFFLVSCLKANSYTYQQAQENIRKSFNSLLQEISKAPADTCVRKLQLFLEEHPNFEATYDALLDRYLYENQILDARDYFTKLASENPYSRNSNWMLARIFLSQGKSDEAFNAFQTALNSGAPSLGLIRDFVAFDHQHAGRYHGLALLQKLRLSPEMMKTVSALYLYFRYSYQDAALQFQEIPAAITHDPVILHIWGNCYYRKNRYTQADSVWRIGLEVSSMSGNLKYKARFFTNLGLLNQIKKEYDLSLAYYDSAYVIAEQVGDMGRLQIVAGYRAYMNRDRGHYLQAQKQFRDAIHLAVRLRKKRTLIDLYKGYAGTLYYLGEYRQALATIDSSELIATRFNDARNIIIIKLDKAGFYTALKQSDLARKTIQDALHLAQESNLTYYQKLANAKLGEVFLYERQYREARNYYERFVAYLNNDENLKREAYYWQGRIGRTYFLDGNYEQAKIEYLKAIDAAKQAESKTFAGWFLLRIGEIELKIGNIDLAIQNFNSALEIAQQENNSEMLWEIKVALGNTYQESGDLPKAISAYSGAARIIEATRGQFTVDPLRIGYFVEASQVYRNLVDCFGQLYQETLSQTDLDSVFYFLQMGRSRALLELRRPIQNHSYSPEYLQAGNELRILQHQIRVQAKNSPTGQVHAELLADLNAARYSLLAQELRAFGDQRDRTFTLKPHIRSLKYLLQALGKTEQGLLQYHISEKGSFVFVADDNGAKIVRLELNPQSLASDIDSLVSPFHNVDAKSVDATVFKADIAYRLYELLVKPIEKDIPLPDNMVIVPDVVMMQLPFEMLLTAQPEKSRFTPKDVPSYANSFLGLRYTITYSPGTVLETFAGDVPSNPKILAIANPFDKETESGGENNQLRSKMGWRFDPLRYAKREVNGIQEIHKNTTIFELNGATKANLVAHAKDSQILHFATHAFADTAMPDFSGLVLAVSSDSTDDGFLMGYEIPDFNLKCELATLSACETGRGKIVSGEGVLGLPRQFLASGAKSVLMTHWRVDDKFASELMLEFYRNYLKEGYSKSKALSVAKCQILQNSDGNGKVYYQHPFFWASFVLYGDPGRRGSSICWKVIIIFVVIFVLLILVASIYRRTQFLK